MSVPSTAGPTRLNIEIWSDVMCPWCVIGHSALQQALGQLEGEIAAEVVWRPFELNPGMPPEGEGMTEHMLRKYGQAPSEDSTERMRQIAEAAGYDMRWKGEGEPPERRLWNTLDAHRLLTRALELGGPAMQTALKLALFDAHFQYRRNVSDRAVLREIAMEAGMPGSDADAALDDGALARAVRAEEAEAMEMGVTSVPMMLIERKFLIPGAQDVQTYAAYLRKAAERLAQVG